MPANSHITATYRITTPMFCAGAEQQQAELRLQSFKGALRFWWRTLMWGKVNGVKDLHEREAKLFGSSEHGQSKVRMKMVDNTLQRSTQSRWPITDWQSYPGYGLIETTGKDQRKYIAPNQTFTIHLNWPDAENHRSGLDGPEQQSVQEALIALGLFGGLGGRSRKGWGSIQLESLKGRREWYCPKDTQLLCQEIKTRATGGDTLPEITAFSCESSYAVGPVRETAKDAHMWISERYKEFIIESAPKETREAFGLPRKNAGPNAGERRASPLFIHIQLLDRGAVPIVISMPGRFLPKQEIPKDEWHHINDFLKEIRKASREESH